MFRISCGLVSALAAALIAAPSFSAGYPEKPVRLIIPFSAGGATDVFARALANSLEKTLGTNIIVDNRGGAGGTLGAGVAAGAAVLGAPHFALSVALGTGLDLDPPGYNVFLAGSRGTGRFAAIRQATSDLTFLKVQFSWNFSAPSSSCACGQCSV